MTIDAREQPPAGHVAGYRRTARLTGEEDFVPAPLPGLTIQLASLWS